MNKARLIALYLPQFYPIKENDEFWGKGFTEWRNVAKARPLYGNHYQPRIPADLGFYDLRLLETQIEQAKMAMEYGIEGFCYWHYWFGNGKMVLEKPMERILESKQPDFPFCVGWANHSWSNKTWEKTGVFKKTTIFLEQTYLGDEDLIAHFKYLLPAFKDDRYIKVDNKPLFMVFNPFEIPNNERMITLWNRLAIDNGLEGIHFVARAETATSSDTKNDIILSKNTRERFDKCLEWGYDAIYSVSVQRMKTMDTSTFLNIVDPILRKIRPYIGVERHDYKKLIPYMFCDEDYKENVYPQIMPHWDNTPRQGKNGYVYTNESPVLFEKVIDTALEYIEKKESQHKIVFVHSWNEWGEGAYLEPDLKFGMQYIDAIKKKIVIDQ